MKCSNHKKVIVLCAIVVGFGMIFFGMRKIVGINYISSRTSVKGNQTNKVLTKKNEIFENAVEYNPKIIDKNQIKKNAKYVAKNYKISMEEAEKTITQTAIEKKALYLAAESTGTTVTDQEVTTEIERIKATFASDHEGKKELQAQIDAMGTTEDEYWKALRPQYKSNIMVNKYLVSMYKKKCIKEKIKMYSAEYAERIDDWHKQLIKSAIKKYQVVVN